MRFWTTASGARSGTRAPRGLERLEGGLGDLELLARRELVGHGFGREDDFRGIRNGRGRLA